MNSGYSNFGKIFFNSLHKNLTLDEIDTIWVGDTGLSDEDKKFLNQFPKVKIIDSGINTKMTKIHTQDWLDSVQQKTILLRSVCTISKSPVVMIDLDSYFISDFHQHLKSDCDIQVIYRENKDPKHIASWFAVNNLRKGIEFIDEWIQTMDNWKKIPKESPSLNHLVLNNKKYVIGIEEERLLAAYGHLEDSMDWNSHIVHFKSSQYANSPEEDFRNRVFRRGFEEVVKDWVDV
jgi:hypothetical protein